MAVTVPSFVGTDYFCDVSGSNTYSSADRLWDKQGCLAGAEDCCAADDWFYKDLPQATTDDIEFRVCTDQDSAIEDVYIEDVEIYVKWITSAGLCHIFSLNSDSVLH